MLTVKDLHKSYQVGKTTYEVLKGVSLTVEKGEFVAVMGPSGSGKTTLLNCISCYIPIDSGEIMLGDRQLANLSEDALAKVRNRQLGFVFQDFLLLDGLTVRENILLPAIIGGAVTGQTEARADQLCDVFGISAIRDKYPAEISGGEKQRTAVARALINHPLLILGQAGIILFAVVVALACVTTAVGLVSACADYFSGLSGGRVSYRTLVCVICVFSAVVSNFGLNEIIAIASPILSVVYPPTLVLIVLALFGSRIRRDWVFRLAALGALAVSLLEVVRTYTGVELAFLDLLPLASLDFGWVLPAAVCGAVGALIPGGRTAAS